MPPPQGTPNFLEGPGDYTFTTKVHSDTYSAISPKSYPAPLNKSVFIVGASKGLGKAAAISFAQAGASHIAIGARSSLSSAKEEILVAAAEAKRPAPKVLCVELDITSQSSTENAAKSIEKEFGKLDIVIIYVGILGAGNLIADSDPEEWWNVWTVNLKGPYMATRAILPLLLKGGDKTIVAVSSVGAHLYSKGRSSYQSSKLAILRFMEFVTKEYGDQGVVGYSIHPGNVVTDIVGGEEGLPEFLKPVFTETPQLSGDTVVFLTSEKRDWLSGRYVNCTWDMVEFVAKKNEIVKGDKLKVRMVL